MNIPPGYVEGITKVANIVRDALAAGLRPLFRMPGKEYMVAIPLDLIGERCCGNEEARIVVELVSSELANDVTVTMLRISLDLLKYPYEVISVEEFMPPGCKLVVGTKGGKA